MGIVEVGSLFAPLARRRAVATCRPSIVLFDGIDNSKKAHRSQKPEVQGGAGGRGCIGVDGVCRNDIIPYPDPKFAGRPSSTVTTDMSSST